MDMIQNEAAMTMGIGGFWERLLDCFCANFGIGWISFSCPFFLFLFFLSFSQIERRGLVRLGEISVDTVGADKGGLSHYDSFLGVSWGRRFFFSSRILMGWNEAMIRGRN